MKMMLCETFFCLLMVFVITCCKATSIPSPADGNIVHVNDNRLQHSDDRCIFLGEHSACYDQLNNTEGSRTKLVKNSYYDAFMSIRDAFEEDKDIGFRAFHSCQVSVKRNIVLTNSPNISLSILLIRPNSCKSTGNILGFFYEAISFGLANGYLIGRLDPLPDENCGIIEKTGKLETFLPRLIIPKNLNISPLSPQHCNTIDIWPWQNPQSYFWGATEILGQINIKMMKDYSLANIPENIPENSGDSKKVSESVGIHYRCGDSFLHRSYGVFPFKVYKNIFKELAQNSRNISQYIIYTDVNKHGLYGQLCWNLLGELQQTVKKTFGLHVDVVINFSSPSHSISMLHMSKIVICSVSTFCFFSSFGSTVVYQPENYNTMLSLFGYPKINGKSASPGRKLFQSKLLRPKDFPSLNTTQFTDLVLYS